MSKKLIQTFEEFIQYTGLENLEPNEIEILNTMFSNFDLRDFISYKDPNPSNIGGDAANIGICT